MANFENPPAMHFSDDRKIHFTKMCQNNAVYQAISHNVTSTTYCTTEFADYRDTALSEAQGAFLAAVVWGQVANIIVRKTTVSSILSWSRMTANRPMLYSFISEFGILFAILYVPGLNKAFLVKGPTASHLFCSLWVIPAIILWEEVRKLICRMYPKSWFDKYSNF